MTANTKSPVNTKAEKELANQEITTTIDNLRREQKKEREQNKNLKAELKNLVNELFTLPELRSKAQRLLNQAVEAATQELTTKNFCQTELSLLEKPTKRVVGNNRKSMSATTGAEADGELSNETEYAADLDIASEKDTEVADDDVPDNVADNDSASYAESITEIEEDSAVENDKDAYDFDDGDESQLDEAENKSFTEEIACENETGNLFEDVFWHEEENMAKNISDADEQLLKVLNDNFEGENLELFNRAAYENPFEINQELSNIYAEKLKKLEETTANVKNKISFNVSFEVPNISLEQEIREQNPSSKICVESLSDKEEQREIAARALMEVDCMFKQIDEISIGDYEGQADSKSCDSDATDNDDLTAHADVIGDTKEIKVGEMSTMDDTNSK